jgi:hypothetical protein
MKTKLALMLWLAIAGTTAIANAQEPRDRVQQRLEEIKDRLALTPEQIEQVRPVLTEEAQKLRALRDRYEGGNQSRRSRRGMVRELRDIRSDAEKKLTRILSKSQMDELKKLREQWREELRDRAR